MASLTQVASLEGAGPCPSVLRSPSTRRLRPSMAGVADRTAEASERALADLTATVSRLQAENAALRGEVAQLQAQSAEARATSEAAIEAQSTTIESQTGTIEEQTITITDLRGELAKVQSANTKYAAVIDELYAVVRHGGSSQASTFSWVRSKIQPLIK